MILHILDYTGFVSRSCRDGAQQALDGMCGSTVRLPLFFREILPRQSQIKKRPHRVHPSPKHRSGRKIEITFRHGNPHPVAKFCTFGTIGQPSKGGIRHLSKRLGINDT
ncbi:hypothetical protein AAY84_06640 [Serratia marcescens]|nr:hypothetical protein AAY84_06640 [Serratia marcescens]